ncbi:MAG TPA: hypothetical protein VFX09_09275 [Burkholderiales bacterium]|nr:hypothetical protein [Burkholderiales bacterium]
MRLLSRFKLPVPTPSARKTWQASQQYELEHAIGFMDAPAFRELHLEFRSGKRNLSAGYRDALVLKEWFAGSTAEFDSFVEHLKGSTCLEIGPCVASQLTGWDVTSERHVVEPLLEPIEAWQRANLGGSLYEGFVRHAVPGEKLIDSLVGQVGGAVLCRNMLDHTPKWPFVLANISAYAAPGCKLLLWTDLDHRGDADEGHYDITPHPEDFKRLVAQLGFRVIREYSDTDRHELNWGCFAERL